MTIAACELDPCTPADGGMLAFATAALRSRPGRNTWAGYTLVFAALMLVTDWSYAHGNGDPSQVLLLTGGALVPLWLIWTGRTSRPGARRLRRHRQLRPQGTTGFSQSREDAQNRRFCVATAGTNSDRETANSRRSRPGRGRCGLTFRGQRLRAVPGQAGQPLG